MNKSKIYILSPDTNVPTGGIKQLYRHVDILNKNGFKASIIHSKRKFRCTWFENDTNISYLAKTKMEKPDYLVVPEIYGELFSNEIKVGGLNRKLKEFINLAKNTVIFNQCCYLSFNGYSIAKDDINPFWLSKSVIATIVVSEDSRQYMHYVFPNIRTFRIRNSIDPKLFSYQYEKKKQICFMSRKLRDDVTQVINILKYRNFLGDFKLIPIENRTEQEVAEIMKDSLIFLSFSYREGCPLPPMEAMMCGCLVIGYDGRGGREYFNNELSYPIDGGDIISFAKTVEEVVRCYNMNQSLVDEKRQRASEFIRKTYSPEKETEEIAECWKQIIAKSDTQG
jgi:glycosyltransferase involved in cell wall biosynthesis